MAPGRPDHGVRVVTARMPYEYVVLRCVPRVDREEFVNVGVVLHCRDADVLACAGHVDAGRLAALWPDLDAAAVGDAIARAQAVCDGDARVGAVAGESRSIRFGFLKAPRSTVVQPGPVHGGTTTDPAAELRLLADRLLR